MGYELDRIEAEAWSEKFLHAIRLYHLLRQFDHIVPCGYVWVGACGVCYSPDEGVRRPKRKTARVGSSTVRPICAVCDFAGADTIASLSDHACPCLVCSTVADDAAAA